MQSTPTRRSAAERVTQIADAARAIALESGLAAVTLRAVATGVGVAPALVAHYVPSMDELVADTFSGVVGDELAEVIALAGNHRSAADALSAVLASLLDDGRGEVTLIWVQSWSLGRRNNLLAERVREQMDAWRRFLGGILERGRTAEEFRCDDPDAIAAQTLGMVDGLNAHSLVAWQDASERVRLLLRSVEAMLDLPSGVLTSPGATVTAPHAPEGAT
ncbi:TetR family transcriptional regulator C-terminal domain-containing protein [Microbacterium sp. CFH 31415]|uniref:TetR/AcrR family transcriptional regulator n=1 Tax=Microbacterium sp. CFH 31415 TaxID=2921732 RepID=UPI001F130C0A|nr:TetR family transcriptional regulator C-terminal domain-containing protein [Microbacterium sp. CFH 31415]MCH6230981.1 TetR family transcriptional regulator C-terminal domain-containing protein [Microbacterium sp. CFH 31415]